MGPERVPRQRRRTIVPDGHADLETQVVELLLTTHPMRMASAVRRATTLLQSVESQAQAAAALDRAIARALSSRSERR
jgi:hypothetical protein